MIDREVLAGALAGFVGLEPDEAVECSGSELLPILTAAEKWYDQLPEKCGTCGGAGTEGGTIQADPFCHGKGVLYPPALVERIAKAIEGHAWGDFGVRLSQKIAVAVLDALQTVPTLEEAANGN